MTIVLVTGSRNYSDNATFERGLDGIPDKEYQSLYGLNKRWWLENNADLMKVLTTIKPTANQYKKEE